MGKLIQVLGGKAVDGQFCITVRERQALLAHYQAGAMTRGRFRGQVLQSRTRVNNDEKGILSDVKMHDLTLINPHAELTSSCKYKPR